MGSTQMGLLFLFCSGFDFLVRISSLVLFWLCFVMWVRSESLFVDESSDLY